MTEVIIDKDPINGEKPSEKIFDQVTEAATWLATELRSRGLDEAVIEQECALFSQTTMSNLLFANGESPMTRAQKYLDKFKLDKAA